MSREEALARAGGRIEDGSFVGALGEFVAIPTESQNPARAPELAAYLEGPLRARLERLGCVVAIHPNPVADGPPLLVARRIEDPALRAILLYGHGDVVRGMEGRWADGRDPWRVTVAGERLYGRGTADNKGQHLLNLMALEAVLEVRGRLGFNLTVLIETGEETGSPGLRAFCEAERELLRTDLMVASDGPRLRPDMATITCGNRGGMPIRLTVDLRPGAHHSGNWGGVLANPAIILAHALATITDARGKIAIAAWRPTSLTPAVREALHAVEVGGVGDGPAVDPDWGEPGLSPAERLYGWNSFEILTLHAGTPEAPQNAIPGRAEAVCQLRFVVGTEMSDILPALRRHLDAQGFEAVRIEQARANLFGASRTPPDHPDVQRAVASITRSLGRAPVVLPNSGGSVPGDIFEEVLDLPMVWLPHSYGGCSQHAPDEHLLLPLVREGMTIMTGLFWDLGQPAIEA
jgi:acetylornithine deacetylase/succinyl-diaminopimelate desuccinylase-like protein